MNDDFEGTGSVFDELFGFLLECVVSGLLAMALFVVRRPTLLAGILVAVLAWSTLGVPGLLATAIAVTVGLLMWRLLGKRSFLRWCWGPLVRGHRRHRYRHRWLALMEAHRLTVQRGPTGSATASYFRPMAPQLLKVHCGKHLDRLWVRMLAGQTPADWERAAEGIAHALGARSAKVRFARPGVITLELAYADPLATTIPAMPIPEPADLVAVPVGVGEDGTPWHVRLAGSHVLIAGATGSGKGSVLWSLVRGIAPAIADGTVQIWAIDPKGGMELGLGRPLFARFAADRFEAMAELLEDACEVMHDRARRLAGVTRVHEATKAEPLIVVIIDELANLTAYLPDRKLRERVVHAASLLLTQGRAVGVVVVAALQDPRKDVVMFRNLFPTKIALRLDELTQIDMVLGDGARDQGARCDRIPESLPGIGYVRVDGIREPVRVRASYVTDGDIAAMASAYSAPRVLHPVRYEAA